MSASTSLNDGSESMRIAVYARVSTERRDTDDPLIQLAASLGVLRSLRTLFAWN
jgi:hypothetical protein